MTFDEITKAKEHFQYGINCDLFSEPVTSYAKTAVEALEKQIPKKPCNIKTAPNHAYSTYGDCPCCNEEAFEYQHCCIYCGQALDWSDEKLSKQDEETCDFDFDEEGWE